MIDVTPYQARLVDDTATGESEKTLRETGERVYVKMRFFQYEIRIDKIAKDIGAQPTEELAKLAWVTPEDLPRTKLAAPTVELLKKLGYYHD